MGISEEESTIRGFISGHPTAPHLLARNLPNSQSQQNSFYAAIGQ
jgi:hypothetical protein